MHSGCGIDPPKVVLSKMVVSDVAKTLLRTGAPVLKIVGILLLQCAKCTLHASKITPIKCILSWEIPNSLQTSSISWYRSTCLFLSPTIFYPKLLFPGARARARPWPSALSEGKHDLLLAKLNNTELKLGAPATNPYFIPFHYFRGQIGMHATATSSTHHSRLFLTYRILGTKGVHCWKSSSTD